MVITQGNRLATRISRYAGADFLLTLNIVCKCSTFKCLSFTPYTATGKYWKLYVLIFDFFYIKRA